MLRKSGVPSPGKVRGSIARQALIRMASRIAVVIVLATTLSYYHTVSNLEGQALAQLAKYVQERGDRERAIFSLAEDNHSVLKNAIVQALQERGDSDPREEFRSTLCSAR